MLNKLVKIIEIAAIIGLNGLDIWGNRIDVFYKDGPTIVIEGIDGVELPEELSDPYHDLWSKYGNKIEFVGIKLNLPQELIQDCKCEYWKIQDEYLESRLQKAVSTEKKFHNWCEIQTFPNNDPIKWKKLLYKYAIILKVVNEKNYFIFWDFCKKIKLDRILIDIHRREKVGGTFSGFVENNNPVEQYLCSLKDLILYGF